MAGLAADSVGHLELRPAHVRRHVVGVAVEADRRGAGVGEAEIARDAHRALVAQHGIGLGVLVLARPDDVLVLRHVRALEALDRAMAGAAGAGRDPEMRPVGRSAGGLRGGRSRGLGLGHPGAEPARQHDGETAREFSRHCPHIPGRKPQES